MEGFFNYARTLLIHFDGCALHLHGQSFAMNINELALTACSLAGWLLPCSFHAVPKSIVLMKAKPSAYKECSFSICGMIAKA